MAAAVLTCSLISPIALASPPPEEAPVQMITAPIADLHTGAGTADGAIGVEERPDGETVRLDAAVLFEKDSARLRPAAHHQITELAGQLRQPGPSRITVTGYTDDLGSAAHGMRLSKRRAMTVADLLDEYLGRDWPQITVVGRGEADPAVPNTNERNRELNRRVVITVHR